jgi:hypothetical protein
VLVETLRFCPACGHSVDDNVLYCPACGKKLPELGVQGSSVPLPPPPPNSPYYGANIPPAFGDADKKALYNIKISAIILLISLVAGFSFSFLYSPFSYLFLANPATVGSIHPTFTLASNFITLFAIAAFVGLVIELITILLLRMAFKTLSTVDRPRFKTPSLLTLLLLISLPIVIIGAIIEFAGLVPYINTVIQQQQAGQTTTPPSLSGLGEFLAGAALGGIGGIIAIIGFIGGVMLGVWRLGSRYDSAVFKVAAILFIIPLLDIASPILILIGASQASKKIAPPPAP